MIGRFSEVSEIAKDKKSGQPKPQNYVLSVSAHSGNSGVWGGRSGEWKRSLWINCLLLVSPLLIHSSSKSQPLLMHFSLSISLCQLIGAIEVIPSHRRLVDLS